MADNMCGPSNGAKTLVSHVDRDRSLHQDRLVGTQHSSQSFRSQQPTANGDAAFQAFQSGVVGPRAGPLAPLAADPFGRVNGVEHFLPAMGGGAQTRAPAGGMNVEQYHQFVQGLHSQPNIAAASGINHPLEHSSSIAHQSAMSPGPGPRTVEPATHLSYPGVNASFAAPPLASPGYMGAPLMYENVPFSIPQPFHPAATPGQASAATTAEPAISDAAFQAAFADFDDGDFQQELDSWMSVHGATAEEQAAAAAAANQQAEPTSAEWDVINADLERLALDAEARAAAEQRPRPKDEEGGPHGDDRLAARRDLVLAASDILTSVSANTSAKFQKSTFLELMRRIRDEEVTVAGNSLVDVHTGEEIATKWSGSDDGHGASDEAAAAASANGDSGL